MNIADIKKRIKKHRETEYDTAVCNHLQFSGDVEYLLSIIEQAEKVLTVAVKHIDGKAETFSEREKIPVLFQLNESLQAIRGN